MILLTIFTEYLIITDSQINMPGKHIKLILFLFLSLSLKAQYNTNVHSISRREGLSNGAVNSIVKDAEGYMWFGTWNGLR